MRERAVCIIIDPQQRAVLLMHRIKAGRFMHPRMKRPAQGSRIQCMLVVRVACADVMARI